MPDGDHLEQLDRALARVVDVLEILTQAEWDDLCAEERESTLASIQYWDAMGMPEVMLPERTLGAKILGEYLRRYPALIMDVEGSA
jgi:hypothetical protein